MTNDEHARARAMGLRVERGMLVWHCSRDGTMTSVPMRVVDAGGGAIHALCCGDDESVLRPLVRRIAPDLRDRATYLLALRQWCERAEWRLSATLALNLMEHHDPERLADLLRETASPSPRR